MTRANEQAIINALQEFISSSGGWKQNEFTVFGGLLLFVTLLVVFYFGQRNSNKMTAMMFDMQKSTNEVIRDHTLVTQKSVNFHKRNSEAIQALLKDALEKHEDTHDLAKQNFSKLNEVHHDVQDIKDIIGTKKERYSKGS